MKDHPTVEQKMFSNACGFIEGGDRCAAAVMGPSGMLIVPMPAAIVCYVFSVEILLKLLLQIAQKAAPRKHDLGALFNELPDDYKSAARSSYDGNPESQLLDSHLTELGSAFIKWRYWHEAETLAANLDALRRSLRALVLAAQRLKPELQLPAHMHGRFA